MLVEKLHHSTNSAHQFRIIIKRDSKAFSSMKNYTLYVSSFVTYSLKKKLKLMTTFIVLITYNKEENLKKMFDMFSLSIDMSKVVVFWHTIGFVRSDNALTSCQISVLICKSKDYFSSLSKIFVFYISCLS